MENHSRALPPNEVSKPFVIKVNGHSYTIHCPASTSLLSVLREYLGLTGTKQGCDTGECGACTVGLGHRAIRSCRVTIGEIGDLPVTTIEGLSDRGDPLHPLQQAFLETGAVQCGFCTPGMIMAAWALLQRRPDPDPGLIRTALQGNLCRCTGYQPIEEAVLRAARQLKDPLITKELSDMPIGGLEKVTGQAVFTADYHIRDSLFGAIVWSPIPSGTLTYLDTSAAKAIPGVFRIVTAADIPGLNGLGRVTPHRPLLVTDRVRFTGDAVAMVLADSPSTARTAAACIRLNMQSEPPVVYPDRSLSPNSPTIHPEGNLAAEITIRKAPPCLTLPSNTPQSPQTINRAADPAKPAFTDGIHPDMDNMPQFRHTFSTGFVEHALLEPEAAVAYYDDDVLTVIGPSQNVFFDRLEIMRVLGIPLREFHRIRVREIHSGAAFGKREDIIAQPLAALGTFLTGRPVSIVLSRQESFRATTKRHPMTFCHTTRIGSDNRIQDQVISILADTGPYSSWAPNILRKAAAHATGPYNVPDITVSGRSVYTNNAFSGAMRGFGAVQAHLASERHMDRIARSRHLDPIEFRKINAYRPGSTTPTGQTLHDTTSVPDLLDAAARALPWPGPARGRGSSGDWVTGFGCAASFYGIGYGNGIPDRGQVEISHLPDGTTRILTSAIDYGQGARTVFARLASDVLHVPISSIDVVTGDTSITPDSGSTVASRQTYVTGNAVIRAAGKLVRLLENNPAPTEPISVKARYIMDSQAIDPKTGQGDVYRTFSLSAVTARVRVNRSTGVVQLEKIVSVHDSGTIIDPVLARSQVTGGVMMAAGMALWEDYPMVDGFPQNLDFSSYHAPRFRDIPEIDVIFLPTPDPDGPMGAKGLGEPATLAAAPAIVNAVCDALDIDFEQVPLTPTVILNALAN